MLSRFHLLPERYGQTNGQTDRTAILISRVSVLMRDKNSLANLKRVQCNKLVHLHIQWST